MNVEHLTYLAEWLEAGAPHQGKVNGFDMSVGVQVTEGQCGTVCCIAGAATQFFNDEDGRLLNDALVHIGVDDEDVGEAYWDDVFDEAKTILGLDKIQAKQLFTPDTAFGGRLSNYNDPARAAKVIRHLIETGDVNWNI